MGQAVTLLVSLDYDDKWQRNLPVHPNKDQLLSFSSFHSNVIVQHKQSSGEDGETIQFNYLHHFKRLIGVWGGDLKKPSHFQKKKNNLFIFAFLILSKMG